MSEVILCKSVSCADTSGKHIFHSFNRRSPLPSDVHIKIRYSGVCHSDIHCGRGDWGPKSYPLCTGHEILGEVVNVGAEVSKVNIGEVAGVGCFVDSCRGCEECKEGEENYCSGPGGFRGTYAHKEREDLVPGGVTQGGYSTDIVVDERYVVKVPEALNRAEAAPLLCAGITCFAPFIQAGVRPGMKVAVAGLGGLGHMAVKIAKKLGAEVTVLTRSQSKVESALAMGASKVVVTTNEEEVKAAAKSVNLVYNCISASHDMVFYLSFLKNRGTMIVVGLPPEPIANLKASALAGRGLSIKGSLLGGIKATQEMIDFCARHNIVSDIELIPATPEAVDVAWERTMKSDVKYRFVLDTAATLEKEFDERAKKRAKLA
ncbi:hypothetical protein TrST_g3996 [Triparma strigata]|uniref:Enoyl reductase (ER) domain-containing protein n=1 Tax=Triparma strigata TaxID=1606541 RepID=A0A9W7AKN8_9STRA|nr:hypothetical protein TrST_g3996 [Triparma strigata]